MSANEYRLGYRGDIEGLRAVAILLVVAAHAGVPWLAGGFVGVDVFFVLSGFLITGLLVQEITNTGRLQFSDFYVRRLRRLLPALLVMLVVVSLLAALVLAPAAQRGQATAAAMAAVWLSNIHFAFAGLDYFAAGTETNLFLHTWSLGVEEQFYVVWPILLVWLLNFRRDAGRGVVRLGRAMLVVIVVSLAACVVLTRTAPPLAFYMMPLRAWQFSAGALVWLYFKGPSTERADGLSVSRTVMPIRLLGWLGLAMIVAAGLLFNANMAYPGFYAMLPTLGAVLVIAAGTRGDQVGVARCLSWRPLQWIGQVSYSWYLWHWPILLLGRAVMPLDKPVYRAAWIALSLLLAVVSHLCIERPVRGQKLWLTHRRMAVIGALALMVVANVLCIRWYNHASDWMQRPEQQRYARAHADAPAIYAAGCDDWYHSDQVRICSFGPTDADHTTVLMGDSIAGQWFPAVAQWAGKSGWRVLVVTKSSCPMVDQPIFYARIGRMYTECAAWREHALQQVASIKPDLVLLGSVSTYDFTQTQWIDGTTRVLKVIAGSSGHVFLLRGTPHLPFDGPDCLAANSGRPEWLGLPSACSASYHDEQNEHVYQWLQQASRSFANVSVIDLNDNICPHGMCEAERDGVVVFRDSQHMTATFATSLSDVLGEKLGPIH